MAQLVIALPLVVFVLLFGYTPFNVINEVIAILGFFSLGVAVFNLLPFRPLDGSIAWGGLTPELIMRARMGRKNRSANWRR